MRQDSNDPSRFRMTVEPVAHQHAGALQAHTPLGARMKRARPTHWSKPWDAGTGSFALGSTAKDLLKHPQLAQADASPGERARSERRAGDYDQRQQRPGRPCEAAVARRGRRDDRAAAAARQAGDIVHLPDLAI